MLLQRRSVEHCVLQHFLHPKSVEHCVLQHFRPPQVRGRKPGAYPIGSQVKLKLSTGGTLVEHWGTRGQKAGGHLWNTGEHEVKKLADTSELRLQLKRGTLCFTMLFATQKRGTLCFTALSAPQERGTLCFTALSAPQERGTLCFTALSATTGQRSRTRHEVKKLTYTSTALSATTGQRSRTRGIPHRPQS